MDQEQTPISFASSRPLSVDTTKYRYMMKLIGSTFILINADFFTKDTFFVVETIDVNLKLLKK